MTTIAAPLIVYRFLVRLPSHRGRRVAHRIDDAGRPLCGVRLVDEQWTLAPNTRGYAVCQACERQALHQEA